MPCIKAAAATKCRSTWLGKKCLLRYSLSHWWIGQRSIRSQICSIYCLQSSVPINFKLLFWWKGSVDGCTFGIAARIPSILLTKDLRLGSYSRASMMHMAENVMVSEGSERVCNSPCSFVWTILNQKPLGWRRHHLYLFIQSKVIFKVSVYFPFNTEICSSEGIQKAH